jgi:hypothetical protein
MSSLLAYTGSDGSDNVEVGAPTGHQTDAEECCICPDRNGRHGNASSVACQRLVGHGRSRTVNGRHRRPRSDDRGRRGLRSDRRSWRSSIRDAAAELRRSSRTSGPRSLNDQPWSGLGLLSTRRVSADPGHPRLAYRGSRLLWRSARGRLRYLLDGRLSRCRLNSRSARRLRRCGCLLGWRGRRGRGLARLRGRRRIGTRRGRLFLHSPRREELERVEVAIRFRGGSHAEVDVGHGPLGVAGGTDGADRGPFVDSGMSLHRQRPEVNEGDRVAVVGLDRHAQAVGRCRAGERHDARSWGEHRLS